MVIVLVVIVGVVIDILCVVNVCEKLFYVIDVVVLVVVVDLLILVFINIEIINKIIDLFKVNLFEVDFFDKVIENLVFDVDSDVGMIIVFLFVSLENYFLDVGGYGI